MVNKGKKDMGKFKVGDFVIQNFSSDRTISGKPYTVKDVNVNGSILIDDELDENQWYIPNTFDLYTPTAEKKPMDYNNVSKPAHYNHGEGIECIDYIKQVLGKEGFVAYCRGNQMKYQHRAFYKGNPVEDMEKAHQYQAWAIETLKEIHK